MKRLFDRSFVSQGVEDDGKQLSRVVVSVLSTRKMSPTSL